MNRSLKLTLAAGLTAAALTGVALAAPAPVPQRTPGAMFQSDTSTPIPGDVTAMKQALNAPSVVKFHVLVVDSAEGEDRTAYLDRVAQAWSMPGQADLLLVLFAKENWDIRFYMGANFRAKGVTVEEMLTMVRRHYLAKSQKGDVGGGLADLVNAINQRMGTPQAAAKPEATTPAAAPLTVPDPWHGADGRQTAAGQVEIGLGLLRAYLEQFRTGAVPEQRRLLDFRIYEEKMNVWEGSDTDRLVLMVKYDVLPALSNSDWIAGNGVVGENGWMVNKVGFLVAIRDREAKVWKFGGLGTAP